MNRCVAQKHPARSRLPCWVRLPCWIRLPCWVRLGTCLTILTALAACGSHPTHHARNEYNPSRYYPPPGPAGDPWGPYIHEASGRFGVPDVWIRRVMRQESGGQEDVISWAGAMGLMQVMPETYDDLRSRYSLGNDPFDPHNNILAGTAYLREMYDRFGAPGFLAAYNAGPNRLDLYLNNGRALPDETINYVASIAPLLGPGTPMSGPLAVYAGPTTRLASSTPAGCDPDAAYNPNDPCTPLQPAYAQPLAVASAAPATVYAAYDRQGGCDPDAAYDPTRPCQPTPSSPASPASANSSLPSAAPGYATLAQASVPPSYGAPVQAVAGSGAPYAGSSGHGDCDPDAAYDPTHPCQQSPATTMPVIAEALPQQPLPQLPPARQPVPARGNGYALVTRPLQERLARPVAFTPGPPPGHWAIQVGAFASLATAQSAAENARAALPDILRTAKIVLPATNPFGGRVAFRARLFGLSSTAATDACSRLSGRGLPCMTIPPSRDGF